MLYIPQHRTSAARETTFYESSCVARLPALRPKARSPFWARPARYVQLPDPLPLCAAKLSHSIGVRIFTRKIIGMPTMRKSPRKSQDSEFKITMPCFLCGNQFQFGPHAYRGRRIPSWSVMVCNTCYAANHDGIVPNSYPHFMPYLKSLNINVQRNKKGWVDWPR